MGRMKYVNCSYPKGLMSTVKQRYLYIAYIGHKFIILFFCVQEETYADHD